jgi:ribosomal protein L24
MIDCPKFVEMHNMFHGKSMTMAEVQPTLRQIIIADVNAVDVNVTTRSKVIEEHVFKDKEPRKANNVVDWEKEEWLKQSMIETIR